MSVKDLPDYTREITLTGLAGFTGLEELAARLGSIVPWDLRGNIVLMEDFESELTEWKDSSSSPGCSATRSSSHKVSGDWGVKLVNSGSPGDGCDLGRWFHFPGTVKYAIFYRFCITDDTGRVGLYAYFIGDGKMYYVDVSYEPHMITLRLYASPNTEHIIGYPHCEVGSDYVWLPMIVTFDLATGKYDKLYLADQEFDISAYSLDVANLPNERSGDVHIYTTMVESWDFTAYADDVIIAKNVP